MKRDHRGITLMTLVITVIVLLILAGITLGMVIGENGIIKKAMEAKENTIQASKKEEEALNALWAELENSEGSEGENIQDQNDETIKELTIKIEKLEKEIAQLQNKNDELEQLNQTLNKEILDLKNELTAKSNLEYLGTGISFNIKERYPNEYQNFSEDNFIVGIQSAPDVMSSRYSTGVANREDRAHALGLTIEKFYDATTGILTISGNTQIVVVNCGGSDYAWTSVEQTMTCFAYLKK